MKNTGLARIICWKNFITAVILTFISIRVFSQNDNTFIRRVDSLKFALVSSKGLSKRDILQELAYEYLRVDNTIALPYSTQAFNMSWQFGDSLRIVKSGRTKGMILKELARYDSMIAISRIILPVAKRNNYLTEMKYILNLLAVAHTHKGEYDKALTYNFESLELRKKHEDKFSVGVALNNIGLVYYKIENFIQALDYFEESIELQSVNGEPLANVNVDSYVSSLLNISVSYSYMNNLTKAEDYLQKGYELCEKGCTDGTLMLAHFASGLLHFNRGNLQQATQMFHESLSLARKNSDQRHELDNLAYLSDISLKSNRVTEAEEYLLQAEPLFESGIPFVTELAEVYSQLSKVYKKLGNYRKFAYFQSKYIELREKVFNKKLTINLMKVHAEYLERENKAKIEAQAKVLELSNEAISRQETLNIVVAGVAILSIAFVMVLMQNVRQKKRANGLLEQRVKERTLELELNHNLLLKSFHERDVQFQRMSTEISSSLATIKGLGVLVSHDVGTMNASNYLAKIEETSNNLMQGLIRVRDQQF
ncbi:MAG TPA: tetratricopeptide repeat protein [Chryseolinea sp.]|nr:tetratricopeptide repeat protein [Chryseolinea sp.]